MRYLDADFSIGCDILFFPFNTSVNITFCAILSPLPLLWLKSSLGFIIFSTVFFHSQFIDSISFQKSKGVIGHCLDINLKQNKTGRNYV